jgi:hypothetical protein
MNEHKNGQDMYVTKADGTKELFDIEKLTTSLKRAGASSVMAEKIIADVTASLTDGLTTHEIYHKAFGMLQSSEQPIALRYSLKRAILELGPSGFPFEDYIAAIFKHKGYETLTDQKVKGQFVEHEIDVVAWTDEKLLMVEAKFHNQPGVKSDLKIALYVKERFDDLSSVTFDYGKSGRKLDEGWLITNTKFTTTAIEYGSHAGTHLIMVGWNYPAHGNLHDMILESKLHPLTCLISLNGMQKKMLLDKGVVLCKTVHDQPELLEPLGLSVEEQQKVLEEISEL